MTDSNTRQHRNTTSVWCGRGSRGQRGHGRGNYQQYSPKKSDSFSGQFSQVDSNAKFLEEEEVEGISLVEDLDLVKQIHSKLGHYTHGPRDWFPVSWAVSLNQSNLHLLETTAYVVASKSRALRRYLLYVDSEGQVYMEGQTQNIFHVQPSHAIRLPSSDGRFIKDTLLDGHFARPSGEDNRPAVGNVDDKLTFFIQDAIRCNGVDLTDRGILERLNFIKKEIMKPRSELIERSFNGSSEEAFQLAIANYKAAHELTNGSLNDDEFSFDRLIFHPRNLGYRSGKCVTILDWDLQNDVKFDFRLKLNPNCTETGELLVVGPGRREIVFDTIVVNDETKSMDGQIVACRRIDHQWIFQRLRTDRKHPNARRTIESKLKTFENPVTREQLLTSLEKSRGLE